MRIDFDMMLFNMDGTNLKDVTNGKEKDARLKTVAVNALLGEDTANRVGGEEKLRRYQLATKIYKGGIIDVTAEEIASLKQLIGYFYPPLVAGQSMELLEKPVADLKVVES